MSHRKYLRTQRLIFFVHHSEGKSVEVVDAQPIFAMRAALLIFHQQLNDSFEFSKERISNICASVGGVELSRITKFCFGIGMNTVIQAILALMRNMASAPLTMATSPVLICSRRCSARFIHDF